ncbi:hypothetical protein [Halosimplex halobium]|uniref:hypothetical protein n=1 Tax=Halosimplex halobium TaxID=3396618 RepID=UPI003F57C9A5
MTYSLRADLDDETEAKLRKIVEDSPHDGHGKITATVEDIIENEFQRRELSLTGDDSEDDGYEEELYDPHDYEDDFVLRKPMLEKVMEKYDKPAIAPEHVEYEEFSGKSVNFKVNVLAAVQRWDVFNRSDETCGSWTSERKGFWDSAMTAFGSLDSRTRKKYKSMADDRYSNDPIDPPDNIVPIRRDGWSVDGYVEDVEEMILVDASSVALRNKIEKGERVIPYLDGEDAERVEEMVRKLEKSLD